MVSYVLLDIMFASLEEVMDIFFNNIELLLGDDVTNLLVGSLNQNMP